MRVAEGAYQQATAFARERRQGRAVGAAESSPIIDHPDVRRMLLTMRSNTERCGRCSTGNDRGGTPLIGVTDSREPVGLDDDTPRSRLRTPTAT